VCLEDTGTEASVAHADIERARTVFAWGSGSDKSSGHKSQSPSRDESEVPQ
jgi:hypothetical protein